MVKGVVQCAMRPFYHQAENRFARAGAKCILISARYIFFAASLLSTETGNDFCPIPYPCATALPCGAGRGDVAGTNKVESAIVYWANNLPWK